MKSKKIIAGLLSLTFVFGGTVSNCAPMISQCITAQAAREVCYTFDKNTGVLTLRGEVNNTDIWIANINNRGQIKSVIAEAGTVLPKNCYGLFNDFSCTSIDLSNADTSKVTDMSDMFYDCFNLTDLDVSGFDTSNVTDMSRMFDGCDELSSIDLSSFDTSNVTNMSGMFNYCKSLTTLDLSSFNTSNATKMSDMFSGCESLTSLDLSGFDTSKVGGMSYMFNYCTSLTSLDVSSFDTSNVANMSYMFNYCTSLTSLDVSSFDTSKVTNMYYMFGGCTGLTSLDVSNFDTSNVTDIHSMFYDCSSLTSLDVSRFDTGNVKNMSYMFEDCSSLTSINLGSLDTSNVTDINSMFYNCSSLTSLDVSGFDTGNVKNMSYMFENCSSLTSINLGSLDTSMVTTIAGMFWGCSGLTKLDVSNFDTSNVTSTNNMFNGCSNLEKLDLSSFDTSKVKYMYDMFAGCEKLNTLTLSENFKNIKEDAVLPNGDGWVNINDPKTVISGNGDYAVIENNGKNTYKLFGTVKLTYPTNIKFEYNQIYHQGRLTWDKVEDADRYGIALYLAGKWRIQKQDITTTSYTTPKNMTPGTSYKLAIAARVDGEWDTANAIKHAVTIYIPNDTDSDGDGIEDFYEKEENVSSYTIAPIIDSWIDDSESISGKNPKIPDLEDLGMNMRGSSTLVSPEDKNGPRKNEIIAIRKRNVGIDATFALSTSKNSYFAFTITGTKETKYGEGYTTDDYESTVKIFNATETEVTEPVEIRLSDDFTEITYVFKLEQDSAYMILVNNPTNNNEGEYEIHISEDNWLYAPNGGRQTYKTSQVECDNVYVKLAIITDEENFESIKVNAVNYTQVDVPYLEKPIDIISLAGVLVIILKADPKVGSALSFAGFLTTPLYEIITDKKQQELYEAIDATGGYICFSNICTTDQWLRDYYPTEWTSPGYINRFLGDPKYGQIAIVETEVDFELLKQLIYQEVSNQEGENS
ncbi:BspA family leucine-rich repeat surface protein [Ruminococcus albus]|uniref:Bacterial surface protein 26-residue PARCEL repeat (3 repeats) n=1 Tax=Ruminococcus albus 8 TaxID=246199 RepID=E9SEK1_RUMAL|nr:BspA family leucine-rich repeat surface protein [Ruminococcus albus]EGC02255.1 bacterial surface protein 26-residue PARCEL repeat (3 repeats) [Ruminococcus albus 8]MCC3351699.1 BspA family leucine-rich repeat surface protein [Ruminococcus albus 8]